MLESRRALVAIASALAIATGTGCAGVPDHGTVHAGNVLPAGKNVSETQSRVLVHGPVPGARPEEVVTGFLTASADPKPDHAIARSYLTAVAGRSWQPNARAQVYDGSAANSVGPARFSAGGRNVVLHVPLVATVGADGGYNVGAPGAQLRVDFHLVKQHGEWRIANPPAGLLLTPLDLTNSLNAQFVYFLNRDMSVVVPNTEFIFATAPGLATALMRALLRGPTTWLSPSVRTAIPVGTTLVGTVPVDDHGTATVNLSQEALAATLAQREQMSAQIVWTLGGIPNVNRIRVLVENSPLDVPSVGSPQTRDSWPTYDPSALKPAAQGFYRSGDHIVTTSGARLPGPLGSGQTTLEDVAVSPDLAFVAGVHRSGSRTTVYTGAFGAPLHATYVVAAPVTPLSWDVSGELWTVQLSATPAVLLLRPGQPVLRIPAPSLAGLDVRSLRISRDGTRVALVTSTASGAKLLIGRVSTTNDGALRLDGFRDPAPDLTDVGDPTWADANTVLVLARTPGHGRTPWLVDVDGVKPTPVTTSGLNTYSGVAAAPGQALLAESAGRIYQATRGSWTPVGSGSAPSYPG
ncbi:MAG: LpqB family beta-propeller domain-containing protein [Actinomycetes bacterium]